MRHIVDELIEERSAGLRSHPWLWRLITGAFYPVLGYKRAKALIDAVHSLDGSEVLNHVSDQLQLNVTTTGLDYVPTNGRAMLIANHPAGIADGVAVYETLLQRREDILIFANRDAVRMAPGLATHIIPVEWVEEKRTRAQQRDMIRQIVEAFRATRPVNVHGVAKWDHSHTDHQLTRYVLHEIDHHVHLACGDPGANTFDPDTVEAWLC